jgi:hypothetical protein
MTIHIKDSTCVISLTTPQFAELYNSFPEHARIILRNHSESGEIRKAGWATINIGGTTFTASADTRSAADYSESMEALGYFKVTIPDAAVPYAL